MHSSKFPCSFINQGDTPINSALSGELLIKTWYMSTKKSRSNVEHSCVGQLLSDWSDFVSVLMRR